MGIQIESVNIKNLGPIREISLEFGQLNLIYGGNETGKTLLVEFILQSLFKNAAKWDLRPISGDGVVKVRGLEPELVTFSPTSTKKMEDFWIEAEPGLPVNLARLLVVKGGELNLAANMPGGVNRELLKSVLTSQAVLDQIWSAIPVTVQKARFENQQITGSNQGQVKELNQLRDETMALEKLLVLVDQKYSRGSARQIEIQIEGVKAALESQQTAKRHQAFLLARERDQLLVEKDLFSDQTLTSLRDQIRDQAEGVREIIHLKGKSQAAETDLANYRWLVSAEEIWETHQLDQKGKPAPATGFAGVSSLAAGLVLLTLDRYLPSLPLFWPGLVLSLLGCGATLLYWRKLLHWTAALDDSRERQTIQGDFAKRFGFLPRSLADLRGQKNRLQEPFLKGIALQEQIASRTSQLEQAAARVEILLRELTGSPVDPENWETTYHILKNESSQRSERIRALELALAKLNLAEDEYLSDPQVISYDPEAAAKFEQQLAGLMGELRANHNDLEILKARACVQTGDDPTTPWADVFYHLTEKQEAKAAELARLTAELIAKIGLTGVLKNIEQEENLKINRDLHAGEVSQLLGLITGRYQGLDLEDEQILIRDPYRTYQLSQISTGAREQTLIALRLGIASRIAGGNPLFVLLDDAFQHTDWGRRQPLLEGVLELVKCGWQVTCLTMDDHIRDLLLSAGKSLLKRNFRYFKLT